MENQGAASGEGSADLPSEEEAEGDLREVEAAAAGDLRSPRKLPNSGLEKSPHRKFEKECLAGCCWAYWAGCFRSGNYKPYELRPHPHRENCGRSSLQPQSTRAF